MKVNKYLVALLVSAALVTPVNAHNLGFDIPPWVQVENVAAFECHPFSINPPQRDRDPVVSTRIEIYFGNGGAVLFGANVFHNLLSGYQVSRAEQYFNTTVSPPGGQFTWSGWHYPDNLYMVGRLISNSRLGEAAPLIYTETLWKGNRQVMQSQAICQEVD